ncbi:MAG: hypothetical protein K6E29_06510 [Cyanobacteria bacterium RUI128]|nr:hypothetical protein [Cyanobacteria bacterium RUI128]
MSELFKFSKWATQINKISDCANGLKELEKFKMTFPPEEQDLKSMLINIKA